jgi:hypothetical protein
MIVQNPLVPPLPSASGATAAPVANAPAASNNGKSETQRPVTAAESSEKPSADNSRRTATEDRGSGSFSERGQELDITV